MKGKYGNKRRVDALVYGVQADLMERREVLRRGRDLEPMHFLERIFLQKCRKEPSKNAFHY